MRATRTILITGATSGLGRHAALHLARRGHRVIATGRRQDALDSLLREAGGGLQTLRLDVTDEASIAAAVEAVDGLTGGAGLDVLVNNAGYGQFGPLELVTDAELRRQFDTNVFGLMSVTRAFLPAMRRRGRGRIVNVSSMGGRFTFPFGGAYHATKYAVEALSDALRRELAAFGVDVVVIEPGAIKTEFATRAVGALDRMRREASESDYGELLARADELQQKADRLGAGPEVVTRAVEKAITARRPRARYMIPLSARFLVAILTRWIPTRWADGLLLRLMGFRRRRPALVQSAA